MPRAGASFTEPEPAGGSARRRTQLPDEEERYPAVKPPFESRSQWGARAVHVSPAGELWVTHSRAWNDEVPRIDVFGANGRLARQVVLPARSRIVGFGRGVLYLVRRGVDDPEWLQRIPL